MRVSARRSQRDSIILILGIFAPSIGNRTAIKKNQRESSQPTGTVYQAPTKRYVILMLMSSIRTSSTTDEE
ncbi:hypothetical protein BDR04DRAFT_1099496 [Suillus decipiens]|nr:hypothetical protein BDR04DRAFT_1099496 [Suillus decipiens]